MEARGEIPPDLPAGCIRVIVHTIVDWPKRGEYDCSRQPIHLEQGAGVSGNAHQDGH